MLNCLSRAKVHAQKRWQSSHAWLSLLHFLLTNEFPSQHNKLWRSVYLTIWLHIIHEKATVIIIIVNDWSYVDKYKQCHVHLSLTNINKYELRRQNVSYKTVQINVFTIVICNLQTWMLQCRPLPMKLKHLVRFDQCYITTNFSFINVR